MNQDRLELNLILVVKGCIDPKCVFLRGHKIFFCFFAGMDGSVTSEPHSPFGKRYLVVEIKWLLSPLKPKTRIRNFMFGVITIKDRGQ